MKNLLSLFFLLVTTALFGQVINENFNSGIPGTWTQGSTGGITWDPNSVLGVGSSGCAIADEGLTTVNGSAWLQTPFVDLTTLTSPEINFSVALVQNNFVPPSVSLWYDNGGGWTQLSSWGSSITQTSDLTPPLDAANVSWVNLNYDLSALAANTNIRFSFGSDFTNGGWVLIDDVVVQSGATPNIYTLPYLQDFEGAAFLPLDWEAFGANALASWEHSTSIGAYGTSSSCAFFDNFNNNVGGSFYGMRAVMLNLTGATAPTLTFDVAYARRTSATSDRLGIWYSLDGTTGWTNLINYEHATLTTAPDQTTYFTPLNSEWESITLDLSTFAGVPLIRFAFENNSSDGNVLYVDNVHFYDMATNGLDQVETSRLVIYPNPINQGIVTIDTGSKQTIMEVRITNFLGQHIRTFEFTKPVSSEILDLQSLSSGSYIISIMTSDNLTHTEHLIIH